MKPSRVLRDRDACHWYRERDWAIIVQIVSICKPIDEEIIENLFCFYILRRACLRNGVDDKCGGDVTDQTLVMTTTTVWPPARVGKGCPIARAPVAQGSRSPIRL